MRHNDSDNPVRGEKHGFTKRRDRELGSSRCSIAPHVPNLPPEAIEFAEAVGQLCEKYSIRNLAMEVEVDRFTRDHQYREDIVSDMSVTVSTMDGRGRPRKRINVRAKLHVSVPIIWEPDSLS